MLTTDQIRQLIDGGRTEEFYNDRGWRKLSKEVIEENHGECLMCKAEKRLTAATVVHHVNYLKARPDLAYSRTYIDEHGEEHMQLMPLCHDCHEKIHERGAYSQLTGYTNDEKW